MSSLEDIRENRLKKLELLKSKGINPYPVNSKKDFCLEELISDFIKLSKRKTAISVVGRIMSLRPQGGLVFLNFNDGTACFQGLIKKDEMKNELINLFNETVDIGDFIQFDGFLFKTKRGEKTLLIKNWKMLSKSLKPLPEKWHCLQDVEERFRKRYLDTLMSEEVKKRFITRSRFISELRNYLDKKNFLEVETPILQSLAGGATAQPFITHHKALDINLYLRVAPELHLKELLIGNFPKVYEIGRLFRNEGIDVTHNPEFTTIEVYEAYADASKHMDFLEKLLKTVIKKVINKTDFEYNGNKISFAGKFKRVSFLSLIKQHSLISDPEKVTREELSLTAQRLGIKVDETDSRTKIMDNIYKKTCLPKLIQPTFIVDYPAEFSPLAKRKENNPEMIDRYQLIVAGMEVINAFSELNDPIDQHHRFLEQEKIREGGDEEAHPHDQEYIEAMEYGMPPAGGIGMSIDRFVMLLTDARNIKEVILFPTLRPKK